MTAAVPRDEPGIGLSATARRAWTVLVLAVLSFGVLLAAALIAGQYVLSHATRSHHATAIVISGTGALWRTGGEGEWRLFDGPVDLDEGDEISTELGTVVWLTLFDGSTLEISERSRVSLQRMRTTRFRPTAKQIVVQVHQGTVYGAMAPRGTFNYAEFEVVSDSGRTLMTDEAGKADAGAFLVDVVYPPVLNISAMRAAVFRGAMQVYSDRGQYRLEGPGQVTVSWTGTFESSDDITRQLIVNGDFESGLDGWETIYTAAGREPESEAGRAELLDGDVDGAGVAVSFWRGPSRLPSRIGIRQRIERTLRLPSSVTLSFEVRLDHQGEPIDGSATVPIGIELSYVDILGQERVWRTAYLLSSDDGVIDADISSTVTQGQWTPVIVSLNNLEPIPKFLRSVVVYASGTSYSALVTNISLTSREGSRRNP